MYHFERYVPHKLGNRKNEVVDTALIIVGIVPNALLNDNWNWYNTYHGHGAEIVTPKPI